MTHPWVESLQISSASSFLVISFLGIPPPFYHACNNLPIRSDSGSLDRAVKLPLVYAERCTNAWLGAKKWRRS